jgi:hypothetical protein
MPLSSVIIIDAMGGDQYPVDVDLAKDLVPTLVETARKWVNDRNRGKPGHGAFTILMFGSAVLNRPENDKKTLAEVGIQEGKVLKACKSSILHIYRMFFESSTVYRLTGGGVDGDGVSEGDDLEEGTRV